MFITALLILWFLYSFICLLTCQFWFKCHSWNNGTIFYGCLLSDLKPSRTKRKVSSDVVSVVEKSEEISTTTIETETWAVLAHKKPQKHWIAYNPRTMRPPPLTQDTKFVKLLSWNVNGLRALLKLDQFSQLAQREDFDVLCLQETKLQVDYWGWLCLEGYTF